MKYKIIANALSVNKCWQGRRFKTPEYKSYESNLLHILPNLNVPNGILYVKLMFAFSSKLKDIDNPLKPFLDILQKKYKFNDRDIYKLEVEKIIVAKGKEFIEFEIKELENK